jgi:hypothetical protein
MLKKWLQYSSPSFYPATLFLPYPTAIFSLIWDADCRIFIP